MAKLTSKNTLLQQTIASVFTTVAQMISVDSTGEESTAFNSTTLDQAGVKETFDPTGYASPGMEKFELFFDPKLAGHKAIVGLIDVPAITIWKKKYSDVLVTPSSVVFSSAGVKMDIKAAKLDGLKATIELIKTGEVTRADAA